MISGNSVGNIFSKRTAVALTEVITSLAQEL